MSNITIHDVDNYGRHAVAPGRISVAELAEREPSLVADADAKLCPRDRSMPCGIVYVDELSRRLTSPSTAVTRVMPAVSSEPLAVLA